MKLGHTAARARERALWSCLPLLAVGTVLLAPWAAADAAATGTHVRGPAKSQAVASSTSRAAGDAAQQALQTASALRSGALSERAAGMDLSSALSDLTARYRALDGGDRARAARLLARPTDARRDPDGYGYHHPEHAPYCSAHFCVHWVTRGRDRPQLRDRDRDGVPNYVELTAATFERVYARENGLPPSGLGWRVPRGDGTRGGNAKVDIYLKDLGRSLYGFCAPDARTVRGSTVASYLVVDNDFRGLETGSPPSATRALEVTAAHEYNHALHNSYDFKQDAWMFEAGAVWMEQQVYPQIDDYLQYLNNFAANSELPLTVGTSDNLKQYGSVVWNLWLAARRGDSIVRSAWESSISTSPPDFAPAAYERAIVASGGAGFADEFTRFAAATAEWRSLTDVFPDAARFPDVERIGTPLTIAAGPRTVALDHTTFALLSVPVDQGVGGTLTLRATLPANVPGGVALVGHAPDGSLRMAVSQVTAGGEATATLNNNGGFDRITGVLVNASTVQSGFNVGLNDWVFSHDDQAVTATLTTTGVPAVDTTAPTTPGVASATVAPNGFTAGPTIDVALRGSFDDISGVAGYSFVWDQQAGTMPDTVVDSVAPSATSPQLPQGTSYLHVRAVDALGNASAAVHVPFRLDSSPPGVARMTGSVLRSRFALDREVPLSWSAGDGQSGIGAFQVDVRTGGPATAMGKLVPWSTFRTRSALFHGAPGRTYCYRVRALNNASVAGAASAERCAAVPIDDRGLKARGSGWKRTAPRSAYLRTLTSSSEQGATLSAGRVRARTIALVAAKCANCGVVDVLWNGRVLRSVSLRGRGTRVVVPVARFSSVRRGTLQLRVASSGRRVAIDGVGLRQR